MIISDAMDHTDALDDTRSLAVDVAADVCLASCLYSKLLLIVVFLIDVVVGESVFALENCVWVVCKRFKQAFAPQTASIYSPCLLDLNDLANDVLFAFLTPFASPVLVQTATDL